MRYFDKDFASGNLDDMEFERRIKEYEMLQRGLTHDIAFLCIIETIGLHDAKIVDVKIASGEITMCLIVGDNQRGHFNLSINFLGVITDKNVLPDIPSEILYYEFLKTNAGTYTLSFMNKKHDEFSLEFHSLNLCLTHIETSNMGTFI